MKGKQGFLVLGLIAAIASAAYSQQYDSPDDFETREVVVNGTRGIMITNYKGTKREIRIPPRINNLPILAIGSDAENLTDWIASGNLAFSSKRLISITIPNGVTTIGYGAFSSNELASVTIPNSVTAIGGRAFGYNQLIRVTIPNGVTTIGEYAFDGNRLTNVTIPNGVTTIGTFAFSSNRLTSVTISNGVTTIGDYAFYLNQLTSITIPNSVTTIGTWAFSDNRLTSVILPIGVTAIADDAFAFNPAAVFNVIINKDNVDNLTGPRVSEVPISRLEDYYFDNGRKAGTYTFDKNTQQWRKIK
jgi:hypothetical protein